MRKRGKPQKILAIDVGGTHVKILRNGLKAHRMFDSGPLLSPAAMVKQVMAATQDWEYEVISIGVPAPVSHGKVVGEPHHLRNGWRRFNFQRAFKKPVRILNDAAMQALGSDQGGKMLFLGLGTGLGSAMVVNGQVLPMELGHLPYKKGIYEDYVGQPAMKRLGRKDWQDNVDEVVQALFDALLPDYIVLGGGNVKKLKKLPPHCRLGSNANAFRGGFRMWSDGQM